MIGVRFLAFLSYVAVALYPFFSGPAIENFGVIGGTFFVYLIASGVLTLLVAKDKELFQEITLALLEIVAEPAPYKLKLALVLNCIGAVFFYVGLSFSTAPAEYGLFGRIEAILLVAGGAFLLHERIKLLNVIGVTTAFVASAVMIGTWSLHWSATVFGTIHVVSMAMAGVLVKDMLNAKTCTWSALLILRTYFVAVSCLCILPLSSDMPKITTNFLSLHGMISCLAAAGMMLVIIGLRYRSQTQLALWQCAAMAPVSVVAATILFWINNITFGLIPALAVLGICCGEIIALLDRRALVKLLRYAQVRT